MATTADWDPRFDTWALEAPPPAVPRAWVHKRQAHNVLVSRFVADGDGALVQLHVPTDHPFFFEHEAAHVPGLALVEAGRQVGLVVAHRLYDVPLEGYAFFIHDLHAHFERPAALGRPIFGRCVLTDVVQKRGRLRAMTCEGHYLQDGAPIGTLSGRWSILPTSVAARLQTSR